MLNFDHNSLKAGFNLVDIDTDEDMSIVFDVNQDMDIFFRLKKAKSLNISIEVKENVSSTIVFWNDTDNKIETKENYVVHDSSSLTVVYGEINNADTNRDTHIKLTGNDSSGLLSSASLVTNRKHYNINVENSGKRSIGNIRNYAVVLKEGKLMIDAIGKINAGAKKAQSHQTSRALAFEAGQSATILPELLIDENDVQASHAMTIGRVDEAHLYYLMSRGLDIKQCTMLISHGYLMPLLEYISDEDLKETLSFELERKIQETCSM